MSDPIDRLKAEARQLSVRDRSRLAHRLLESLDDPAEDPAEVEGAWEVEIQRRIAEYRAGGVKPIPASEVFRQARNGLRRR